MSKLPFTVRLLLSMLVTCIGATLGSYVWEAAETTTFFRGQYGDVRRAIWAIFSGLLCFGGAANIYVMVMQKLIP